MVLTVNAKINKYTTFLNKSTKIPSENETGFIFFLFLVVFMIAKEEKKNKEISTRTQFRFPNGIPTTSPAKTCIKHTHLLFLTHRHDYHDLGR